MRNVIFWKEGFFCSFFSSHLFFILYPLIKVIRCHPTKLLIYCCVRMQIFTNFVLTAVKIN